MGSLHAALSPIISIASRLKGPSMFLQMPCNALTKLGYYQVMPSEPVEGVVLGRPVEG